MTAKTELPGHNYAIILAGGQGARFWPQSRVLEPKQFLSLNQDSSLFAQTVARIITFIPPANVFIVSGELYREQIQNAALPFNIPSANIIFEPSSKNTAPSIALGLAFIQAKDPQANIIVLPCDHFIKNKKKFTVLIKKALCLCPGHELIVFGIVPHRPATGYGYIKISRNVAKSQGRSQSSAKSDDKSIHYPVEKFTEKPDLQTAKRFLREKRYFWNSGIFAGSLTAFSRSLQKHLPGLWTQLSGIKSQLDMQSVWGKIKPVSFDCGVLEKCRGLLMLKAENLGWSDLGSWQAWDELMRKDGRDNAFLGDVINIDSHDTTILAKNRLIAAIGLANVMIVDTPDALLVARKDKCEEVKKVVGILKQNNRHEHYIHRTVRRPWGRYTVLDQGRGFKVKVLEVEPKKALSLQFHNQRSEHWVVVEGQAEVIRDKKTLCVNCNESYFIPVGCVHRLSNPADSVLRIVEVQAGSYLEEDDITRLK